MTKFKKNIYVFLCIVVVAITIYLYPFKLKVFFDKNYNYDTFESIIVEEIFGVGNSPEHKITDPEKMNKLLAVLKDISVKRTFLMPTYYDMKPYYSYIFLFEKFVGDARSGLYISIYPRGDSIYLNISTGNNNSRGYKVVGVKDFKIISDILAE